MELAQAVGLSTLASVLITKLIDAGRALWNRSSKEADTKNQMANLLMAVDEIKKDNAERKKALLDELVKLEKVMRDEIFEVHRRISDADRSTNEIRKEMASTAKLAEHISGQLTGFNHVIDLLKEKL